MAGKNKQLVQQLTRVGEGVVIGTIQQQEINQDGTTTSAVSIDLTTAQVPERRYAAEVAGVVQAENMMRLLFGQTKPIGKGLGSLLVVHVSYRAARLFLNSMADGVLPTAKEYMSRHNIASSKLLDVSLQQEPTQLATVEANIIAASFHGRESCMDLYHSSSFAFQSFGATGKFFAEPIVRITLPLPLLVSVCDALESQKDSMPADELEQKL